MKYPAEARDWYINSNYLWMASIDDEFKLEELAQKAENKGIQIARFYEPDLSNQLTAISFMGNSESKKLIQKLPKMLS